MYTSHSQKVKTTNSKQCSYKKERTLRNAKFTDRLRYCTKQYCTLIPGFSLDWKFIIKNPKKINKEYFSKAH